MFREPIGSTFRPATANLAPAGSFMSRMSRRKRAWVESDQRAHPTSPLAADGDGRPRERRGYSQLIPANGNTR